MEPIIDRFLNVHLPAWFAPKPASPFLDYGLTISLSEASGIPEPSLRLLLTVLAGYPIAIVYRLIFLNKTSTIIGASARNWFCLVAGLSLSYYFNSFDVIHPLTTCVGTWLICKVFGDWVAPKNRTLASGIAFFFNFAYLLTSYKYAATDDYDICYTMQQCVQCLRMIGFGMDYMDGQPVANKKKQAAEVAAKALTDIVEEKKAHPGKADHGPETVAVAPAAPAVTAAREKTPISFGRDLGLAKLPTLPETIAYAFFPFAFLVGPQFSFSLYRKYITMDLFDVPVPSTATNKAKEEAKAISTANGIPQGSLRYATRCFALGVFYLGLGQVLGAYFPTLELLTKAFAARPMAEKLFIFWWTGKTVLNKYLGIWTIAEGPCVLSGITFNGYDEQGRPEWDGLRNVNPLKYEFATSLNQIIGSFNMNTNYWAKLYFMDMEVERRLRIQFGRPVEQWIEGLRHQHKTVLYWITYVLWSTFTWALTTSALYFAAVPFDLLQLDKSYAAVKAVNFVGLWVLGGFFVLQLVASIVFPKKRSGASKVIKTE
ncbi:Lysophosphatidylcholine acyltransferase 3 [Lunasporangiospora selenospora]|uniref:Lysophospholipid acyltransferase 5 n=1 Tax=Lunasporangiospora selenospora TaxID=979761 RepID=A0A9P6KCB3_9FUNG|nr:Lysophosphatidylcholine acyltransferase 3 [Lunasporangiospora selenospora]